MSLGCEEGPVSLFRSGLGTQAPGLLEGHQKGDVPSGWLSALIRPGGTSLLGLLRNGPTSERDKGQQARVWCPHPSTFTKNYLYNPVPMTPTLSALSSF